MRRRIIKQGHNTLTITLPSEWTKRFNLTAGKEVDLIERDNGLFLTTEKIEGTKRVEINLDHLDIPIIWKYFMAVYREGYNEILVKFDPKMNIDNPFKYFTVHRLDARYKKQRDKVNILEALQGFVTRFIDFEIVEHGKDYILIKEMGELTGKEFDNSLRRVFLLIQQMAEETMEAITTQNSALLSHMHDVDINLDKFHDYCIRILNKVGNKEPRKTNLLFSILFMLELIGDEFKNISHHLVFDFPKEKFPHIESLAKIVMDQLDSFHKIFFHFDIEKVKELSQKDKDSYMNMASIYKKSNEDEKEVYHHLRIIQRYINALVELRIEMEF